MAKQKVWFAVIGFSTALFSLCTMMIPVLSLVMAIAGIIFGALGKGAAKKGYTLATFGMSALALGFVLSYLTVVLMGRA